MNNTQLQLENVKNKISFAYGRHISVDEGWYQIVIDCDKELAAIDPSYLILQIKEKFGGLRYYFQPSQSDTLAEMNKVVSKYEEIAARTCEATGMPGVLMKSVGGWRKTLSPEYAASVAHYHAYTAVSDSGA